MSAIKEVNITKGEDKTITVVLKQDGLPKDVTGWTITARLSTRSKESPSSVGALVSCDSGASGADFSAGIVVVTWTDTQTADASFTAGKRQLEIHGVDGSGLKYKWIPPAIVNVLGSVIP